MKNRGEEEQILERAKKPSFNNEQLEISRKEEATYPPVACQWQKAQADKDRPGSAGEESAAEMVPQGGTCPFYSGARLCISVCCLSPPTSATNANARLGTWSLAWDLMSLSFLDLVPTALLSFLPAFFQKGICSGANSSFSPSCP